MNVQEFLASIGTAPPAPVYLFCPFKPPKARNASFELVLAERAVARMVERYVDPTMRDLSYSAYYADETEAGEVVSVALTFPFLTEYRVVLLQNAECYTSESSLKPLTAYLESPSETTILMMVASQVDRRSRFYKACEASAVIVECPELSEHEVAAWIQQEVKARNKSITPAAVRELYARTGTRLSDVNNAINLVCNYVGTTDAIDDTAVATACADVAEDEIWALTDAIASSNTDKAIRVLRELLDLGKNEFEIMGSINWLLKSAYGVARGGPSAQRVQRFVVNKVRPLAEKIGLDRFRNAFALCMDTEIMLRSTGVDRRLALELLVIKLAAPTAKRARIAG